MSAMSASPVKSPVVLPPAGVPAPPPVVATSPQKAFPNLPASLTIAPTKPAGMNHSAVPLSLIADSKMPTQFPAQSQPPMPALQPISQPIHRTPEKPKEALPLVTPPKPTSNGMEPAGPPTPAPVPEPPAAAQLPPVALPKPDVPEAAQKPLPEPAPTPPVAPTVEKKPEAKEEPVPAKPAGHGAEVAPPVAERASAPAPAAAPAGTPAPPTPQPAPAEPVTPLAAPPAASPAAPPAAVAAPAPAPVPAPAPAAPAPQLKVATIPRQATKRKREIKPASAPAPVTPDAKKEAKDKEEERKSKRVRLPTQPYQSPIPELTIIAKMSKSQEAATAANSKGQAKGADDKLIIFYKNEFLAVRNAEGGFYVCQTMQNIYKSSSRIRIRWLSQQDSKDTYSPDFYDHTDFDCILTNLNLEKKDKDVWRLPAEEDQRTQSILKRALDVERGVSEKPPVTEEHPDGLDLSLYRDESQLKKSKRRGKSSSTRKSSSSKSEEDENAEEEEEGEEEESEEEKKLSKKSNKKSSPKAKRKKKSPKKKAAPPEKKAAVTSVKNTTAAKKVESRPEPRKRRGSDPQPPALEKRPKKADSSSTTDRTNKLRSVGERRARNRK